MGLFGNKKTKNNNSEQFNNYINKYLKEDCEVGEFEIIALTGFTLNGAVKIKDYDIYAQHIKCISYIQNKKLINNEICFVYYLDKNASLLKMKDLTAYKIKVKKVKNKDLYYILKIKEKKTKIFDSIIKEQQKPIEINIDNNIFKYNKTLENYDGNINIGNKNISISLYPQNNKIDATESINTLNKIKNNFKSFYNKVLLQCSKKMVVTANIWKDDDDEHNITWEEIYKRIDKESFALVIYGKDYTIYFDDDNLFLGHTIEYNGNIENEEYDATIAG